MTGIAPAATPGVRRVRVVLVAIGVLVILIGAYEMQQTVSVKHIWGLVLWLLLALIIHDGIIGPIVFGVTFAMRKYGRTIPVAVLATIQAGVVVGLVLSIIVVPEIYKKHLGNPNPTVMPFDYLMRFAITWAVILVLTGVAAAVVGRVHRRRQAVARV